MRTSQRCDSGSAGNDGDDHHYVQLVLGVEGYSEDLDHNQEHKCKRLKSLIIGKTHLGPDLQVNEGQQTNADTDHATDPGRMLVYTMLVHFCQRTPAAI